MDKKKNRTQLVFEWIDYLESGNQKAFAQKAGLHPTAVYKWKKGERGPGKSTEGIVRDAYNLTVQEYEAGPAAYATAKKAKDPPLPQGAMPLDPSRTSEVYSKIGSSLSRGFVAGYTFNNQMEKKTTRFYSRTRRLQQQAYRLRYHTRNQHR